MGTVAASSSGSSSNSGSSVSSSGSITPSSVASSSSNATTTAASIASSSSRNAATNALAATGKSTASSAPSVSTSLETMVPLAAFTSFGPGTTPLSVNHQGPFIATTISFNLAPGKSLSDASVAVERAMRDIGMPASIRGSFQGTAQTFQESLSTIPLLIIAALGAIYIVLGILYESYIHPITIISTLPSAGVGALLALLLCDTEFSILAAIGVILLIGIVKKNAILMIDFALEAERAHDMDPRDAIYQACLIRFRPIMMTTSAAMLGALPLAFEFRRRRRVASPAGYFHRRRSDGEPGIAALHDARSLFVSGSFPAVRETTMAPYLSRFGYAEGRRVMCHVCFSFAGYIVGGNGKCARRNEYIGAVHRASGRDDVADDRHRAGGDLCVLQAAGLAVAASGLPDDLGPGDLARRQPGHRRIRCRRAAGTPFGPNCRFDRDDIHQFGGVGPDRAAVRPGCDINGAARDVQAAINAARADLPTSLRSNPTFWKVNPADSPIVILALTSQTLTAGQLYDAAASVLSQTLSQNRRRRSGHSRWRGSSGRAGGAQSDRAVQIRHRA